ncbi:MAG TPA: hypothetical protein VEG65_06260 [Candidatus Bathyarchaeia archaeon]|nr:hypothetical protein [Candidatus Bathyarchaeia archaeon]
MARKETRDQGSKLVALPTVYITDSLHFETAYLALRLTDTSRLVEKREQLIRSAAKCLATVITDDAEMGMLREECSLYDIKLDADKVKARTELREQLAQLRKQHKTLKSVLSAVKQAARSPRTFTPKEYERQLVPSSLRVIMASLSGKTVRFESLGNSLEPIETSDPRVVSALLRHNIGRAIIIQ